MKNGKCGSKANIHRNLSALGLSVETPKEQPAKVFAGAVYECVRCGTRTTQEELAKLPEVKCICGYRVFRKARPSVVKQIKAV
jgi:DNA-directed RNA polymerase subunit P